MQYDTYNKLVSGIAKRAGELSEMTLDSLRASYPILTNTRAECIRYCRDSKLSRSDIVQAIIEEEFNLEFDIAIEST